MEVLAVTCAVALAAVHVAAGRIRFLDRLPRARWLSFASGISVAYVFVHLLPEISRGRQAVEEAGLARLLPADSLPWIVALLGLATFYGLERMAVASRADSVSDGARDRTERGVFWIHIGSFGVYNVLIGYLLLSRLGQGLDALLLFWVAMVLHFFVNDHALRDHHQEQYRRHGRWVLALAVVAGAVISTRAQLGEVAVSMLVAFIGGGVVLNVLKEELPEERKSRFGPFAIGVAAYTALLLAL